jgi:hypothetical protein
VPEGCENVAGLRVWARQHCVLGCLGRAPGSGRPKVGSALYALRRRTPTPSMCFTRWRCAPAGMTTVRPVCALNTAPITTPPSSSIRTDTGSRLIAAQAKPEVSYSRTDPLPGWQVGRAVSLCVISARTDSHHPLEATDCPAAPEPVGSVSLKSAMAPRGVRGGHCHDMAASGATAAFRAGGKGASKRGGAASR